MSRAQPSRRPVADEPIHPLAGSSAESMGAFLSGYYDPDSAAYDAEASAAEHGLADGDGTTGDTRELVVA
jgi:hypothetical protein